MKDHIYKQIELTGTSKTSIEDAVERAVQKASETVRNMHWFEIIETRGAILEDNKIQWQVIVKVAFSLQDE